MDCCGIHLAVQLQLATGGRHGWISLVMDQGLFWTIVSGVAGLTVAPIIYVVDIYRRKHELSGAPNTALPVQSLVGNSFDDTHLFLLALCEHFSDNVSTWFNDRFARLASFADSEELNCEDSARQKACLMVIASQVDGFPGGVYALDAGATVRAQHTPRAPSVPNIAGHYIASEREYFKECRQLLRPIVSNAFSSANRPVEILVVAVPRFNKSGEFIGILDGVIDIVSSPFSAMAREALRGFTFPDHVKPKSMRLLLIDENKRILASSHTHVDGKSSVSENPVVLRLCYGIQGNLSYSCGEGAIACVEGTPFFVICHEHALAKTA